MMRWGFGPALRLIRDFEKSARINEMKPSNIISRKKELNEQMTGFEQQRKQHAASIESRKALMAKGAKGGKGMPPPEIKHSKHDSETLPASSASYMIPCDTTEVADILCQLQILVYFEMQQLSRRGRLSTQLQHLVCPIRKDLSALAVRRRHDNTTDDGQGAQRHNRHGEGASAV